MSALSNVIGVLAQVLTFAIVIRALLSWFPGAIYNPIGVFIVSITEPILAPLRRIVPRIGVMDITPIVAIVLLQLLAQFVVNLG